MEKKLPKGWEVSRFKDVVKYQKGKKPKVLKEQEFENSLPYLDIKAFEKNEIRQFADKESSNIIDENSIGIVWDGARSGWVTKGKKGAIGSTIAKLTPVKEVNVDFIFRFLQSKFQEINTNTRGTGIPHVDPDVLWNLIFPLPPLIEQERIVAKLDTLFTHLETAKAGLEKIPVLLKQFRQAVLTQAVTGKLTEEWREGKELGEWETVLLNNVCISITDGDHQAPPQVEKGIPFLVISNVSKGYFDFDNVTRFVPIDYYNSLKDTRKPKKGDVLYTVTGSYGIPLLVGFEKEFCFQRHIAILRPNNDLILSNYLKIVLESDLILKQAHNVATGTAQLTVPLGGIKNFDIILAPIGEQTEIVRRVENLFAKADATENKYKQLKEKIGNLPQAVLAKAFRGEI
jgi:type I restriction enzyme S subunit